MVERVKRARHAGTVVVATTTDEVDDQVVELCAAHGLQCYRGHGTDLLDRHYRCAVELGASVVLKVPSDCPLIDPKVLDRVVTKYNEGAADYVSNLHPATYPDGQDIEVISISALETAWRESKADFEREHTTPFIWERPDRFRIENVEWETGLDYSMTHRLTIDYREDYDAINAIYQELYSTDPAFDVADIVALLKRRPELKAMNERYAGVNWYRHHLTALKTIGSNQTKLI